MMKLMLKKLVTGLMLGSMKPQASGLPDVVHLDVRPTNCKFAIGWSLRQIEEESLLHSLDVLLNRHKLHFITIFELL
jgi:hypothetical protein